VRCPRHSLRIQERVTEASREQEQELDLQDSVWTTETSLQGSLTLGFDCQRNGRQVQFRTEFGQHYGMPQDRSRYFQVHVRGEQTDHLW